MPALTRRRDPDARQETWLIHCCDLRIGTIAERVGNPTGSPHWQRALVAIGRRSRGDKPQKAVLGTGSIKRVEMTERQRKLDDQRKERDPGNAFDIRPNPRHAATRPTSKGLRIKPLSRLPQVSRSWMNGVNDGASKCRQNSAICGIFATPHHIGGGEPIAKPARPPLAATHALCALANK
jgi:hypothetical protein